MIFPGCKTGNSWSTHKDHKEPPCDNCYEGRKKYHREYKKKNSKKVAAQRRDNYVRKRKDRLEYGVKYRIANPEYVRKNTRIRRARKLNALFEKYTTEDVLNLYGTLCHICNEEIDLDAPRRPGVKGFEKGLHLDHLIPLSKGGNDLLENIRPAHGFCNLSKKDKLKE